ncbi:MAG: hypothetical protein AAFY71_26770 [Bacteroidota bacterium]
MKNTSLMYILLPILMFQFGCNPGQLIVERSNSDTTPSKIDKVISINPEFTSINLFRKNEERIMPDEGKREMFNQVLKKNAKESGIELVIYDSDHLKVTDTDYFNYLLPLRQQILRSNLSQNSAFDRKSKNLGGHSSPQTWTFIENPIFDSDYSWLSDKYGTRYFALHGVISLAYKRRALLGMAIFFPPVGLYYLIRPQYRSIYYSFLVDVKKGEVVYRELREFGGEFSKNNLEAMVFDSFNILNQQP